MGIELCGWFSHGSCLQFHVVSVLQVDVHPDDEEEINQTALVLGAPLDQNMEEEEEDENEDADEDEDDFDNDELEMMLEGEEGYEDDDENCY